MYNFSWGLNNLGTVKFWFHQEVSLRKTRSGSCGLRRTRNSSSLALVNPLAFHCRHLSSLDISFLRGPNQCFLSRGIGFLMDEKNEGWGVNIRSQYWECPEFLFEDWHHLLLGKGDFAVFPGSRWLISRSWCPVWRNEMYYLPRLQPNSLLWGRNAVQSYLFSLW